ncbi:hypothetical protein GGQ85_002288 [Nitrobacter vulgaris]|uniref:hypothetical protein n=1 Tax=Nitrobacter vulgaris TaxID=29421 RepID=UPI00285A7DE8|nr:hypothetical protein [Nitrobacter vulgaris]MDR6304578.1 hypothetical protein [Nitrobacter vulgaris]
MILSASYILAALAIYGAALYLIYRLQLYLTASSMLLGFLLLIHGPAYLAYMLFHGPQSVIYRRIAQSLRFNDIVMSLNLSIALLFAGIIAGIELVDHLAPSYANALQRGVVGWNDQPLAGGSAKSWPLFIVILALCLFMAWVSATEKHIAALVGYLSVAGSEVDKIAYRQQYGGSHVYLYRVVINSIAPMLIVWGALSGWTRRWWPLLAATSFLLALTLLGKLETLSKAPIALFLIQLFLVSYLIFRNSITWRVSLASLLVALIIFYPVIRLAIPESDGLGALRFFYYRAFDISNEALLEFFGAFPERISHTWGANIRTLAMIWGLDYTPAFDLVSRVWRGTGGSTTTAMFIADAWADFSYLGVFGFSIVAGVICRAIDLILLTRGKTILAISVLAATFLGIYNLMISALPTAVLSGGLVIAPLMAIFVSLTLRMAQHSAATRAANVSSPSDA